MLQTVKVTVEAVVWNFLSIKRFPRLFWTPFCLSRISCLVKCKNKIIRSEMTRDCARKLIVQSLQFCPEDINSFCFESHLKKRNFQTQITISNLLVIFRLNAVSNLFCQQPFGRNQNFQLLKFYNILLSAISFCVVGPVWTNKTVSLLLFPTKNFPHISHNEFWNSLYSGCCNPRKPIKNQYIR